MDQDGFGLNDAFDHERRYDNDLESKVNGMLAKVFGEGTAYAMVDSTWTYDTTESLTESYDPNNKVTNTDYQRTEKSMSSDGGVGGPAGTASNIETNSSSGGAGANGESDSLEEKRTSTHIGTTLEYTSKTTPELAHLSVALVVDESLSGELDSITQSVRAAVGFSEVRGDTMNSISTNFASLERDESGAPIAPAPSAPEMSPWKSWALEHGLEVLAACAFLFVLLRSLGGSKKAIEEVFRNDAVNTAEAQDPELVARAAVEELVHSDPEQVSAILSRWALEQPQAAAPQQ